MLREFVKSDIFPALEAGQGAMIIHLGDHDPSGVDMSRDLEERIKMFAEGDGAVGLVRVALNMEQIRRYNPPPSPAKITDSRAVGYIRQFGHDSWELDALSPTQLDAIVRGAIKKCIKKKDSWEGRVADVDGVKRKLLEVAESWE